MTRWFDQDKSNDTGIIKSVDGQGCPRCKGMVYEAEKVMANENRSYHRKCASCITCHQKLDSGTLCNGPDEIYCQNCYSRKFGGAGFRNSSAGWVDEESSKNMRPCQNIDTAKLKITNDPESCRKCSGKVYEMERISLSSGIWHKQCFTCTGCNYSMTNTLDDVFDRDNHLYCRPCLKKLNFIGKPMTYSDTKKIPAQNEEDKCPKCEGAVFEAEKLLYNGRLFHQSCFSCSSCTVKLDSLNAYSISGRVHCKVCYNNNQALQRPSTPKSMMAIDASDPSACPRCGCKVYEAEKMMSKSRLFHKQCFTCSQCKHTLDYSNCMEGPNSEIYCKTCYVKEYFTGGRNKFGEFKGGEGSLDDPDTCPKCLKKTYDMERVQTSTHAYHKQCLSCQQCSRYLDTQNYFDARDGNIYCKNCYENKFGVKGQAGKLAGDLKKIVHGDLAQIIGCTRCGGNVYEAEKIVTSAGPYHPGCFKCFKCSRSIDQSSCYVKDEIYCFKCYNEEFNIRSRSRSRMESESNVQIVELNDDIIAQSMVETNVIMADEGDRNKCPRCNGKVFEAEKMTSNKGIFHRKCFTCQDCHRNLDPSSVNDGPDDGCIFCNVCYQRRFGPTVRVLSDHEEFTFKGIQAEKTIRVRDAVQISGIPAVIGVNPDNCIRCNGNVSFLERSDYNSTNVMFSNFFKFFQIF